MLGSAIRKVFVRVFWFLAQVGSRPAGAGWRRSSKHSDMRFK
jgi:hypothetical protein